MSHATRLTSYYIHLFIHYWTQTSGRWMQPDWHMIGTQCFLVTMVLQVKSVNLGFIYHFAMIWISLVLFYSAMNKNTFIIYLGIDIACNLFFQRSGNPPDASKWSFTKPSCIGWRQFRPWPLRFLWHQNLTLTGFLCTLREHFSLRRQMFHSWESISVKPEYEIKSDIRIWYDYIKHNLGPPPKRILKNLRTFNIIQPPVKTL